MSCFGCFSSSRSDSPPQVVEEKKMRCASLGENVSAKIMDLVGESLGPDKQIVSVAVPAKGCTTVLYRQSDRYLQQDASKLPAKIVRLSSLEAEATSSEMVDGPIVGAVERSEVETPKTVVGADPVFLQSDWGKRALGEFELSSAPKTFAIEQKNSEVEDEEKVLSAMVASLKPYTRPWSIPDDVMRDGYTVGYETTPREPFVTKDGVDETKRVRVDTPSVVDAVERNETEGTEKALSELTAILDSVEDSLAQEGERVPDEIVRDEGVADEVIFFS
ncbi:MAG: hypothetical protein OXF02_06490 [Simkaniaceae bacterium]|nr:hypothetical protein [Simkaniaceae bacterium]